MGELGAPLRVLVVEDDDTDAALFMRMLRAARGISFTAVRCDRLDHAIARAQAEAFDVALLDLSLPDTTGIDTVRRAREAAPALPLVVLTGLEDLAIAAQALRSGAEDYLVKDEVSWQVLVRSIRYAIERHASRSFEERREGELHALLSLTQDTVFRLDDEGRMEFLKAPSKPGRPMLVCDRIEGHFSSDSVVVLRDALAKSAETGEIVVVRLSRGVDGRSEAVEARVAPCGGGAAVVVLR